MELGFVGLGKMGGNMVTRLMLGKHSVIVNDISIKAIKEAEKHGATGVVSFKELVDKLTPPRHIWVMVPSGDATDSTINELKKLLSAGDTIIDGGNSYYKDSVARAAMLAESDINFMDAGTSGGIWGLEKGYCLMVGCTNEVFDQMEPVLKTLAPEDGYLHAGKAGSGHYVKMVHNGIEYGMLQAYAEGFALMEASDFDIDMHKVSHLWNQGSVVRSWLLELAEDVFSENPKLDGVSPYVEDSGEGRWTVLDSIEKSVPAPVIIMSLLARFSSRDTDSFSAKTIAALRNSFGGHVIKKE